MLNISKNKLMVAMTLQLMIFKTLKNLSMNLVNPMMMHKNLNNNSNHCLRLQANC